MAGLLLFAAWTSHDAALWNSRWIARETARLAGSAASLIEGEGAVREALEAALGDAQMEGVALFGHGLPHAFIGADGSDALDAENVPLLGERWAHLLACNTGRELVPRCGGPALLVGYEVALIVEWAIEDLPEEIRERLARVATATTFALVAGARTRPDLQAAASAAADALFDWLALHTDEGSYLGICVFAQQLVDRMVVSPKTAWERLLEQDDV